MTDQEIFNKTREMLYENMIKGYSHVRKSGFHYTKPSPGRYPFQFFWDTCFHVYILTALGEHEMAKKHLISLFALQEENGFVGHIIYWDRVLPGRLTDIFQSKPGLRLDLFRSHMSALIQPPMAAQAVKRVYKASGDREFLKQMLPKLKSYYNWLAQNRDFDGDGLITIISPFESGMDWKPTYDLPLGFPQKKADWRLFLKVVGTDMRNFRHNYDLKTIYRKGYFLVKDAGFNTVYVQNLQALAGLCGELQDPEAENYSKLAGRVRNAMLETLYDEKDAAFYDVYGKQNKKIKVLTPTIFYPVVIKDLPDRISEKVIKTHLFNPQEFGVHYPIPSVAKHHRSFNPTESMYIWRGPTWIFNNWFMHQFMLEKGYREESAKLVKSIKSLIKKSGFREYYNPFTGDGYGAKDFTWAGLVVDMIRMEKEEREKKKPSTF